MKILLRGPRRVGLKKQSFENWIDKTGIDVIAGKLGVHRATVVLWRKGLCDPRVDYMRRIKRLTRGAIGYDQMIDRAVLTSRVSGEAAAAKRSRGR